MAETTVSLEPHELLEEAYEFLTLFYEEYSRDRSHISERWREACIEIEKTGTYTHTYDELAFGARVAWRNSVRCIGRLRWQSLIVRDARTTTTAQGIHSQLVEHLIRASNGGRIRSIITVFQPDSPVTGPGPRIWNDQLVRYAGWGNDDGTAMGDPKNIPLTRAAERLGWHGRRGPFTILPLIIETSHEGCAVFPIPTEAVLEVPISHPEYPWFDALNLRWYAVPAISNMCLQIGGVNYCCAPFNGFYMGDEIASRNFSDLGRYNQVQVVASRLGLDTSSDRSLWRDRAVIELNRAVLHSFDLARVTMADHHSESANFMRFVAKEERAGRTPRADWTWINSIPVPPQVPSFHRTYDPTELNPNFWPGNLAICPAGERICSCAANSTICGS